MTLAINIEKTDTVIDRLVQNIEVALPKGPRLAVIGSASLRHKDSEATCIQIGKLVAGLPGLVLITGGIAGVGEAVGYSFYEARKSSGGAPDVYHILPRGYPRWDYGDTLFAASDMNERREVLGRLSRLYVAIEGGPGTEHEARVALSRDATFIPVGRSGGFAATMYAHLGPPSTIDEQYWAILGAKDSTPENTACTVMHIVKSCLELCL
jgi:hypothetical protein